MTTTDTQPAIPGFVKLFARVGEAMLRLGVSRPRVEGFVAFTCFWTSQAIWLSGQPRELACGIIGGWRVAERAHLHGDSTPRDRLLFCAAFVIGALQTIWETPACLWRNVRDAHRQWKGQSGA